MLILFLLILCLFCIPYFHVRAKGEANCCLIAVVVAVAAAAAALPLPTGSLFGATGWELESEVVLISGRAPPIEKSHLAVFLSRQTPGKETSRKTEVGISRPYRLGRSESPPTPLRKYGGWVHR